MNKMRTAEVQLSLFEGHEDQSPSPPIAQKPTTVLDFVKARFENGPDMTQEECRRWVLVLIQNSFRAMD